MGAFSIWELTEKSIQSRFISRAIDTLLICQLVN